MDGAFGRWLRGAFDFSSWRGSVWEVLSRRKVDRFHRPVRRRRTDLRRSDFRWRTSPTDVLSRERAVGAALGLGQPGVWLDQRQQAHHFPITARLLGASDRAP